MTAFPFSAIVGQDELREALLACAVDPAIGGVLIRGERGTAKTTAVRGLAPLLPPIRVREGDAFNTDPDHEPAPPPDGMPATGAVIERPVRLVELPVGATADRVLGTLDLDRALADGARAFQPGLLAAAHRGVLYVDEVNLLPDHLVDVLLDAAALGCNHVERDGLSVSHAARFLLVGTMNPEEGDLRPQLLDRFGLSVEVTGSGDPDVRVEIVHRRLAFDADPQAFAARFADEDRALAAGVAAARERDVRLPDRMLLLIAGTCARLGVDGHRADIVCARAARALAALDGEDEVTREHVRRAARLALAHRRRRGPLQAPGLAEAELDDAMRDGDARGNGDLRSDSDARGDSDARSDSAPRGNGDAEERGDRAYRADAASRHRTDAPASPGRAPLLQLAGAGRGDVGRRSRAVGGEPVDSREPRGAVTDLALAPTLHAAAARRALQPGGPPLHASDLREHIRAGKEGNLVVFCVDASGSMGARGRMARVKGAILGLLNDAYQCRDRVALVTFRGQGAQLVLPPTGSVERAAEVLATLPTGGATPLAEGLAETERLIGAERRRDPDRRALALVVTDGRTTRRAEAIEAARKLARTAAGVVIFDGEQGPVKLNLAAAIATAANARLLPLEALA